MRALRAFSVSCPFTVSYRTYVYVVIPALIGQWICTSYWVWHAWR